jgi:hypothetical protein
LVKLEIDPRPVKTGFGCGGAFRVLLFNDFKRTDAIHPVGPVFFFLGGFSEVSQALAGDRILMPGFSIVRRVNRAAASSRMMQAMKAAVRERPCISIISLMFLTEFLGDVNIKLVALRKTIVFQALFHACFHNTVGHYGAGHP